MASLWKELSTQQSAVSTQPMKHSFRTSQLTYRQKKQLNAEDTTQQSRNQTPPRRHGDTEKHGGNHNFARNAREIGFMRALEKNQELTTKNTEKKQRSR